MPTTPPPASDLLALPFEEVLVRLGASRDGLSDAAARRRLDEYGANEIAEKKVHPILRFLSYVWGPIPWMIEAAAALSAFVRDWVDFSIIIALLVLNAVVGFWEEYQAGNAVAALRARLALRARVRRDGVWRVGPSRELVPGDRVRLRSGDIVPADARLLDGDPIEVDQAALTGESLPVERKSGEAVYSGSSLKRGEIDALVVATGARTYFGKTVSLVATARTVSHFQRAVLRIGHYLILLAIVLVTLIVTVSLLRHAALTRTLEFALVLTVAAVPVALPAVLSVTMAVGARLLARREAIVTRLSAIEEMAGVDVLCSDKTGTLTRNELRAGEPAILSHATVDDVLVAAALASREEDQDTIDLAVLAALPDRAALAPYRVMRFLPFDPVHKRTEATVEAAGAGRTFRVSKGAPQVILALIDDRESVRPALDAAVAEFARHGFRSLGVARTDEQDRWRMLGVLPLFDPARDDSRSTVEAARGLGITVKMLTGDQVAIAQEIAEEVGLGTRILDANILDEDGGLAPIALVDHIERADGFAQVYPEHKYRIVELLQRSGHIVGMTGDGVNDAPALKKADVGIAVSGATDAARAAAAVVLLAKGLSVIVDAVGESRKIFQRMQSYAIYRIAETIRVLLFMTLAILVFGFYPVTAVMIVLLAILNDAAILTIAYDNAVPSPQPEAWNMRRVLGIATVLGVAGVVASFGLFFGAERLLHIDRSTVRTLMYLKLSVAGHLTIFVARTRGPFWSTRPATVLLVAVVSTQLIATAIAVTGLLMPPIPWIWAAAVWGYALGWFVVNDALKQVAYRILGARGFAKKESRRGLPSVVPG